MGRRSPLGWLIGPLLACCVAAGGPPSAPLLAQSTPGKPQAVPVLQPVPAAAPEVLRCSQNVAGDSKPVVIEADEIAAWQECAQTLLFVRGKVLLRQSVIQARFDQGVARVDCEGYKRTGIWHVEVYAEGNVLLDRSADVKTAGRAVLDIHTRGEVKLNALRDKVQRRPMPDDPLVVRGRAEWPAAAPAATVKAPAMPALRRTSVDEMITPPAPFLPGALTPPVGGPTSVPAPTPPPVTPVPVQPPKVPQPPAAPVPRGATGPAPPGVVTRVACYQPGATPPAEVPAGPPPPAVGGAPPGPPPLVAPTPAGPPPPPIAGRVRGFSIAPRSGTLPDIKTETVGGEQALVVSGGIILQVRDVPGIGLLDMEADQVIVWSRGGANPQRLLGGDVQSTDGTGGSYEFYLRGNVEIRRRNPRDTQTLRADEVYYDVNRSVAIALSATVEMRLNPVPGRPNLFPDPIIFRTDQLEQLSATQFQILRAEVFSSKLPSDPGLKVYVASGTVDENVVPRRTILGTPVFNRVTGEIEEERQTLFHGRNAFFELEDVPFFYLPYLAVNANEPLGPVREVSFGYNTIFGFTPGVSLDVYDLLGIQPYENTRWRLNLDYLSYRGPAVGSDFDYSSKEIFGLPGNVTGFVRSYGIIDRNFDILGGPRPVNDFDPTNFRGRLTWRQNVMDLPDGFTVQSQISGLSDRNFLEEYFYNEWNTDINQETFVYVKQQQDNWAWTALVEPNIRPWITETESLPRLDGYLLGVSPFDRLTSNTRADLGFFILHRSTDPEPLVFPSTDRPVSTGRANIDEELSLPLALGPVKFVPYLMGSLTGYTEDEQGNPLGRAWGGFGARASMPLTRIYPDVSSELFNLTGINHKIVMSANYFNASTNEPFSKLPQLDRLQDDPAEQSLRDIRPLEPTFNPAHGTALEFSPLFDPQIYAIRTLVLNRIDTRDTIQVLQLDLRQRLQTKRGYPGAEHIVDWMVLDLSASYYPAANRDNFGSSFAFLQYDYIWNIGDRTSLVSTGWVDPETDGPRVFTFGAFFNRPDRTNFYLGYRQIDPIDSKLVTAAVTYIFSPKYAMTASASYDLGTQQSESNSLVITRVGSDLQVSAGISYNAITQSVGAVFVIVPNLVAGSLSGALNPLGYAR